MPDIKITFGEVRTKTAQMRRENENLTDTLRRTRRAVELLEEDWTSDTSDTIRARIAAMQPKFDCYREIIESYCKFLDNTVSRYEAVESDLQSGASSQFL